MIPVFHICTYVRRDGKAGSTEPRRNDTCVMIIDHLTFHLIMTSFFSMTKYVPVIEIVKWGRGSVIRAGRGRQPKKARLEREWNK